MYNNQSLEVTLEIRGDVYVTFKDEVYRTPSEFPDELREIFKQYDYWNNEEIYIGNNNWFEYLFSSDGEVYENDLSKATPQDILEDMTDIARQYFNISNS